MDRCDECGFDPADLQPPDTAVAVRSFARRYRMPLTRGLPGEDLDAIVRQRPAPDVWSALEYVWHVRDVFGVFEERIRAALVRQTPDEPVVDWESRVAATGAALNREQVTNELSDAATTLGVTLSELTADEWDLPTLTGRGSEVRVAELATIAVHEGSHHLLDVGRSLRTARGR